MGVDLENIEHVKDLLETAESYVDIEFALNYLEDECLKRNCMYIMQQCKADNDSIEDCVSIIESDYLDNIGV